MTQRNISEILAMSDEKWIQSQTYSDIYNEIEELKKELIDTRICKILSDNMHYRDLTLNISNSLSFTAIPKVLKKFEWLNNLIISTTGITKIENIPPNVTGLAIEHCYVDSIKQDDLPYGIEQFHIPDNPLNEINGLELPITIKELNLENCRLERISKLNCLTNLQALSLKQNKLKILPELPESLRQLDISHNELISLYNVPDGVTELDCSSNKISNLNMYVPSKLVRLIAFGNNIQTMYTYPKDLKYIDLSFNNLGYIGTLPDNLEYVDISRNKLYYFPSTLPSKISDLDISNNNINENLLKQLHEKYKYVNIISDYEEEEESFNLFNSDSPPEYDNSNYWDKFKENGNKLGSTNQQKDYVPYSWDDLTRDRYRQPNYTLPNYSSTSSSSYGSYDTSPKRNTSLTNPYFIVHKKTIKI